MEVLGALEGKVLIPQIRPPMQDVKHRIDFLFFILFYFCDLKQIIYFLELHKNIG